MIAQAPPSNLLARALRVPAEGLFRNRVLAISSGKGGVGKTNVVAGLAIALARQGQRVVIVDADFGLANLDILLGLAPQSTLEQVLRGEKVLEEILIEGPEGIRIVPASSGVQELTRLDGAAELRLVQGLQRIAEDADWMLVDTAAGVHDSVVKLLMAAQQVLLVATPEPASLVDAYAVLKVLHLRDAEKPVRIVVNNAQSAEEAEETIQQLDLATRRFLGRPVEALGAIPHDAWLLQAVREKRCVVDRFPQSPSAKAFESLAKILIQGGHWDPASLPALWENAQH
ncbi:MAG TPA: MinD/ParA family protein [Holophagaceae bacterium]|nr:MinD/ParA family protein [Holophagaceae bacterium]